MIVGGGVAGTSIAYHLARLGWRDVVVLERGELTGGSTFHAAGLVGQLRSSGALTRITMTSAALYPRLLKDTGRDPGWKPVGSLRVASSRVRLEELARQRAFARRFGLEADLLGPREAREKFPLMTDAELEGALWVPADGHVDPAGLTLALAEGARAQGVRVRTGERVAAITLTGGRVAAVVTERETIACEVVVNAAGIWAAEVGRLVGVPVPVVPMAHQYLVTAPLAGVRRDFPVMRDPDRLVYAREEVGGLVVGGFERACTTWGLDGIPADFTHRLLPPDWERFAPLMDGAVRRIPRLATAEAVRLVNGPEAYTLDGEFILGEVARPRGFWVAAGFCAHGIAGAGGVGEVLAHWIVEGRPPWDVSRMDVRRFGPQGMEPAAAVRQATGIYSTYYDIRERDVP